MNDALCWFMMFHDECWLTMVDADWFSGGMIGTRNLRSQLHTISD